VTLAGVDEAGRGPLAGPVCAAAVILGEGFDGSGLADSKQLSAARREALALRIREGACGWAVAWATVEEIDRLNIREATFLAMTRAISALALSPAHILIDGNVLPKDLPAPATAIIRGDLTEPSISAASILAKTHRDARMKSLCLRHPGYGFSRHKGYGTAAHAEALARLGPCALHRRSFAPVRIVLEG